MFQKSITCFESSWGSRIESTWSPGALVNSKGSEIVCIHQLFHFAVVWENLSLCPSECQFPKLFGSFQRTLSQNNIVSTFQTDKLVPKNEIVLSRQQSLFIILVEFNPRFYFFFSSTILFHYIIACALIFQLLLFCFIVMK